MKVLRIRCECGRNLANVRSADNAAAFTVTACHGVTMQTWSPSPMASEIDQTYTFECRCGRSDQRRGHRIFDEFSHRQHERGVAFAVLGRDL